MTLASNTTPEDDEPGSHAERVKQRHEDTLLRLPFVTGVGLGRNALGDDAIIVYLLQCESAASLPKQIEGVDVVTEVTGEIDAF